MQLMGVLPFTPAETLLQAYSVVFTFACNVSKIQHGTWDMLPGLMSSLGLRYPWTCNQCCLKDSRPVLGIPTLPQRTWQTKLFYQINSCCIKLMLIEMQDCLRWLIFNAS